MSDCQKRISVNLHIKQLHQTYRNFEPGQKTKDMGLLIIEGATHTSIGVNYLEEAEAFYGDFLGLEARGRLDS